MSELISENLMESWKRSKMYGADMNEAKDAILTNLELKQHLEQNERLLSELQPTIDNLVYSLKLSGSVVVISNASGVLLKSIGDPDFLEDTKKIHVLPGADWSERVRGTNSAGTVAFEEKPVVVVGKEHFLKTNHSLYCAGSPIFNPKGELQAVLNVSGSSDFYHPSIYGMIDVIARNIENWMLIRKSKQQKIISLHPDKNRGHEALLAVDQHGKINGINREARHLLGMSKLLNDDTPLKELLSNTEELFQVKNQATAPYSVHLQTKDADKKSFYASVVADSIPKIFPVSKGEGTIKRQSLQASNGRFTFGDIYGKDENLLAALDTAKGAALTDYTVVITGESGTGKEMVSQAIHQASHRSSKPFIALNCGAITKSLMESELFGYEPGSFTGAKRTGQPGVFEKADGGTLFLDEIAELPMDIQIALLRVLQDFHVTRIGGEIPTKVDVRIITATHTDLWEKVQKGEFRADLFYRLQGLHVKLPPFRERQDRLKFAKMLLNRIESELNSDSVTLSPDAEQLITAYSWPGNVRQLVSALRAAVFSSSDGVVDKHCFPDYIISDFHNIESTGSLLQDTENELILKVMRDTSNNISQSARILGIGRNTLYRKLKELNMLHD